MIGLRASLVALAISLSGGYALAQTDLASPTDSAVAAEEPSARLLGGVAAIVNDEVISISDVAQRARLLLITLGVPASQENLQQALPRALEELIDEHLQLQKAGEFELEVSEAEIENAVRDVATQNQSDIPTLYETLSTAGVSAETLKDQMKAEIAWRRIVSGLFGSRIRISKLQIDGMLERLRANANEERYQLSEIFLYAPTEADKAQVVQGANVIVDQLRQGARFQLAAQQYSNAPTAAVGGDLGWVSPAELEPEVQAALAAITPPALSSPIVVNDGVYIYAVLGKQDKFSGATDVSLRQVLAAEDQKAALNALTLDMPDCTNLKERVDAEEGLTYADLGRVPEEALTDEVRVAINGVPTGGASGILTTASGPVVLFVCDRGQTAIPLPSRDQIEDRLYSQQLTMLGERELRDLKREATIIRR